MATEHTLRLGIDGRPAEAGGRTTVRSLEQIRKAATDATGAVDKSEASLRRLKKAADGIKDVGQTLTKWVTLPVLGLGAAFVKMASDAQETRAKFEAVFKGLTGATRAWAADFAKALGRNQVEIEGFLARLQDTFVPLGFARTESAALSKALTTLAIDIAAFDNRDEAEVVNLLTSAIVGNTEAVRGFGIVISEATMKAELYRMGITKGITAATEQEKVQARLNIIMASSADASGQAMREADGAANSFRGLASAGKDAGIALGERLLPIVVPMIQGLRDMLQGVSGLNPEVVKWGLAMAGAAALLGPIAIGIGSVAAALWGLAAAGGAVVALWTGGLSIVIGGLTAWFLKTKLDATETASAIDKVGESIQSLSRGQLVAKKGDLDSRIGKLEKFPQTPWVQGELGKMRQESKLLADTLKSLGADTPAMDPFRPVDDSAKRLAKTLKDLRKEAEEISRDFNTALFDAMWSGAGKGGAAPTDRLRPGFLAGIGSPGSERAARAQGVPMFDHATGRRIMPNRPDTGIISSVTGVRASEAKEPGFFSRMGMRGKAAVGLAKQGDFLGAAKALGPLALAAAALAPVFEGLKKAIGPALEMLAVPLRAVGAMIGALIIPVLKLLENPLRMLAKVATWVTEAMGWLIRSIGKAVNFLLPGSPGRGVVNAGQEMMDGAKKARQGLDVLSDASEKLAGTFSNIPKTLPLNLIRSTIGGGARPGTPAAGGYRPPTAGGGPGNGGSSGGGNDAFYSITFAPGSIVTQARSGDELLSEVERAVQNRNRTGGSTHLPGARVLA